MSTDICVSNDPLLVCSIWADARDYVWVGLGAPFFMLFSTLFRTGKRRREASVNVSEFFGTVHIIDITIDTLYR